MESTVPAKNRKQTTALNVFKTIYLNPDEDTKFYLSIFYESIRNELKHYIEEAVEEKGSIKRHVLAHVVLEKISMNADVETISPYFHSYTVVEYTIDNVDLHLEQAHRKIVNCQEKYLEHRSGWILKEIKYFELKIAENPIFKGSSYIKLPSDLKNKKAILNIKNMNDSMCFLWCILAAIMKLNREANADRVSKYELYKNQVNMAGVDLPVPYQKIPLIEKANNLRINVFDYEEGSVCVLFVSDQVQLEAINLLLIGDEDNTHYCLIKNFSRFMGHSTKHEHATFYCYRCLHGFSRSELLEEHLPYCKDHDVQHLKMPTPEKNILKFSGTHLHHPIPYTIYTDFEALLAPIHTCTASDKSSYQINTAEHIPCGFAYVIIDSQGRSIKPVTIYRGENAVEQFLDAMIEEKEALGQKLCSVTPMTITPSQEREFR